MKTLIKVIASPFIIIGVLVGVVYTIVDFVWFTAKETSMNIAKYMANKKL